MTTTRQYWNTIKGLRNQLAALMGTDVTYTPPEIRAMGNANLAVTAVLVKTLVDKGLITDADLQAHLPMGLGGDGSAWDVELPTDRLPPA